MVVVAIIAILAAVGYPSYTDYVTRSHRQAGKNWLYTVADRQEQFFQDNKQYAPNLTALGFGADAFALDDDGQITDLADPDRKYVVILVNTTATTYTALAVPVLKQFENDAQCGALTLTHRGEQGVTGVADNCW
jgi:type IV pilus assembly protein PilE